MSSSSSEDLAEAGDRGRSMESSRAKQEVVTKADFPISVILIPAPEQPETPVRITIENLRLSSTVGEVRQRAQGLIASQPDMGRLRLIQSGRLLSRDDQALEELVSFEQAQLNSTIPMHLILRPLPGSARPRSVPRSASPLHAAVTSGQVGLAPGGPGVQQPVMPMLQGAAVHGFPPRPSSTPAVPHPPGPFTMPGQPQGPGGFASHGVPGPQQAQFMQQLQQQHLNMMQAMLRPNPMQAQQPGPQGHPMTLPDFQRMYNHQAQARQAQQAAMSGRTTPQAGMHPSRPGGAQASPPTAGPNQAEPQNTGDTPVHQHIHGVQPIQPLNMPIPSIFHAPRIHMTGQAFQAGPMMGTSANQPIDALSGLSSEHDTVFLLSSPSGYEAILVGPRGTPSASVGPAQVAETQPLPAALVPQPDGNNQPVEAARVPAPGQPIQMQDLMGIMMPLGGHLWLIVRLAGVVALLTLNSNWTRTIIIWSIAFVIYLAQTDVLNPVQRAAERAWVPVRQHIEELVRDVEDYLPPTNANNPDPAQTAARLLRQQRDQTILRRIERGVALFVASFVPGVGEAQVAAREAAERRRARIREEQARMDEREVARQQEGDSSAEPAQIQQNESGANGNTTANEHEGNDNESVIRHRQPHVEDVNE